MKIMSKVIKDYYDTNTYVKEFVDKSMNTEARRADFKHLGKLFHHTVPESSFLK